MRSRKTAHWMLHATAVCFSLATTGGARAAAPAESAPPRAAIESQRARFERQIALGTFARDGAKSSRHFGMLQSIHQLFPASIAPRLILGSEQDGITIDHKGMLRPRGGSSGASVSLEQLVRLNITSQAALDAAIDAKLVELTGATGPGDAQSQMAAKITDARALLEEATHFQSANGVPRKRAQLLARHYAATGLKHGNFSLGMISLGADAAGQHLVVRAGYHPHIQTPGGSRQPHHDDFAAVGVPSEQALHRRIAERVIEAAGLTGVPEDARTMRRADRVLAAKVKREEALVGLMESPQTHADLALLVRARQEMAEAVRPAEVVLARRGGKRLVVESRGNDLNTLLLVIRSTGLPESPRYPDSITELAHFGITSPRTFEAAVHRAMLEIAPEDLD